MSQAPLVIASGVDHFPGFLDRAAQEALRDDVMAILGQAPLFRPRMPRTGKPFTVLMSNCGPLGWVSDEAGYRYQPTHPKTGRNWPPMPPTLLAAFAAIAPGAPPPEACLINLYDSSARMGLHQDRDEEELSAPVVSVSLGGAGRLAFHGVDRVIPGSSTLLAEGGRINLTLRRVTRAPR